MLLKLTALHYTLKTSALERFHNINEHGSGIIFEWERANERAVSTMQGYTPKPFMEPFAFIPDDYEVREDDFRIRAEDIYSLRSNALRTHRSTTA